MAGAAVGHHHLLVQILGRRADVAGLPEGGHVVVDVDRGRHPRAAVPGLQHLRGRALPFVGRGRASAVVFRAGSGADQREAAENPQIEVLELRFLVGAAETGRGRELEGVDVERLQVRQRVAALLRGRVADERKARLTAGVRRRDRIAAAAVTRDARTGHRLVAAAVEIDDQVARAGDRVVVVELREPHRRIACCRILGGVAGSGAVFDGVGADVPLGVGGNRGFRIERRVRTGEDRDVVVLDDEGDVAAGIEAPGQAPAVAEIAHVAEHHGVLLPTGAEPVDRPEPGERVALRRGVDGTVVRGGIGAARGFEGSGGDHRIRKYQEAVDAGRNRAVAGRALVVATVAGAACRQRQGNQQGRHQPAGGERGGEETDTHVRSVGEKRG